MSTDPTPERVADTRCETGEGPLWHPDERVVYFVDIPKGRLYAYDPDADDHELVYETDVIGGFTIERDGALLLFEDGGTVERWTPDDGASGVIDVSDAFPEAGGTRFNDVIADPEGRVFAGTMPTEDRLGALYRLDPDGSVDRVIEGVDVSNGMGFPPGLETFYYTESEAKTVYRYDYDRATGAVAGREPWVTVDEGIPDGMTVDETGYVWSARWNGSALYRYSPEGEQVGVVGFPARKVSSVTFGGPGYEGAYVTTAGGGSRETEGKGAGALFRVDLDARGVAEFRSAVAGE